MLLCCNRDQVNQKPHHMKKIKIFTLSLSISTIFFLFPGCSKDKNSLANDDGSIHGNANVTLYAGRVSMKGGAFTPNELLIAETGTVLWVNDDNKIHTVTADNGAFDSGDIQPGATFTYTFNTRGAYPYHCKHHLEMVGTVRVMVK